MFSKLEQKVIDRLKKKPQTITQLAIDIYKEEWEQPKDPNNSVSVAIRRINMKIKNAKGTSRIVLEGKRGRKGMTARLEEM